MSEIKLNINKLIKKDLLKKEKEILNIPKYLIQKRVLLQVAQLSKLIYEDKNISYLNNNQEYFIDDKKKFIRGAIRKLL